MRKRRRGREAKKENERVGGRKKKKEGKKIGGIDMAGKKEEERREGRMEGE